MKALYFWIKCKDCNDIFIRGMINLDEYDYSGTELKEMMDLLQEKINPHFNHKLIIRTRVAEHE